MSFTEGPWEAEYDENGAHVIRMGSALKRRAQYVAHHLIRYDHGVYPDDGSQFAEAEANARLMAASPDLLHELKNATFEIDRISGEEWSHISRERRLALKVQVENAEQAIAKAEGQ